MSTDHFFPQYGISIEADTREEALRLLELRLKPIPTQIAEPAPVQDTNQVEPPISNLEEPMPPVEAQTQDNNHLTI
jgi:hypothetical protein